MPHSIFRTSGVDASLRFIDTGSFGMRRLLIERLERRGLKPKDVTDVLLTHSHADHGEGAERFAASHRARLLRHPQLADGDVVRAGPLNLTALYTPGHAPDHIAYWMAEDRVLFTGDTRPCATVVEARDARLKPANRQAFAASLAGQPVVVLEYRTQAVAGNRATTRIVALGAAACDERVNFER